MLRLKLGGIIFEFCFSFFVVLAIIFLYDHSGIGIIGLWVCLLHEMAHILVMGIFDSVPESVTFYATGIRINERDIEGLSLPKQAAVIMAGSALNLLLFAATLFFGGRFGVYLPVFGAANLAVGLLNLIPAGFFDGARLLKLLILRFSKPENIYSAQKTARRITLGIVSAGFAAVIYLHITGKAEFNITAAFLLAYLAISAILEE